LFYRLVLVVLVEARFFVVVAWPEDFFAVDFTVLPLDLLAIFTGVLLVARDTVLLGAAEAVRDDPPAGAIANIRGTGFFRGDSARTCLMAFVCCSSVIRNSW
jgi:hypothetical protein